MYKLIIYIGRFQPFHNGHYDSLKQALALGERVLMLIGSANASPSLKNPFDYEARRDMVLGSLDKVKISKTIIEPLNDILYDDVAWFQQVRDVALKTVPGIKSNEIAIMGFEKDDSSYYLRGFPEWNYISVEPKRLMHATDVRDALFKSDHGGWEDNRLSVKYHVKDEVPSHVLAMLSEYCKTSEFLKMRVEWEFIQTHKTSWENAPYPPVFVTTDAVVEYKKNILLITRKYCPGKSLFALPGGFINQDETLIEACKRELLEETGLDLGQVPHRALKQKVFDLPSRSQRGRTITHAFSFQIDELPELMAGDDAGSFSWFPLEKLQANKLYEDHYFIIKSIT